MEIFHFRDRIFLSHVLVNSCVSEPSLKPSHDKTNVSMSMQFAPAKRIPLGYPPYIQCVIEIFIDFSYFEKDTLFTIFLTMKKRVFSDGMKTGNVIRKVSYTIIPLNYT